MVLISRNFARLGKASEKPDGIVAYVEGDQVEALTQYCEFFPLSMVLISRNFARLGKASEKPDGIVTYVEGDQVEALTQYCGIYTISIASPKEKNLYLFSTASL